MSNVTLKIAGRRYTLACAEGEEEHVAELGRSIDARLQAMPGLSRQSEAQTLLYAALLLADELHEKRQDKGQDADQPAGPSDDQIAEPLEKLAERLETIARELETARTND